jgi:hypothetical protein
MPGPSGTERRSPFAMMTEYWWIGYVGVGASTTSPEPSIASARWAMPSFEPIVTMASRSASRCTSKRRRYQSQIARRSL